MWSIVVVVVDGGETESDRGRAIEKTQKRCMSLLYFQCQYDNHTFRYLWRVSACARSCSNVFSATRLRQKCSQCYFGRAWIVAFCIARFGSQCKRSISIAFMRVHIFSLHAANNTAECVRSTQQYFRLNWKFFGLLLKLGTIYKHDGHFSFEIVLEKISLYPVAFMTVWEKKKKHNNTEKIAMNKLIKKRMRSNWIIRTKTDSQMVWTANFEI